MGTGDLRIAIIGSAGTGKSTLATALAERLRLPLSSDWTRQSIAELPFTPSRYEHPEELKALTRTVAERKMAFENSERAFVADRSTVDSAAFWLRWISDRARDEESGPFIERCRAHAESRYHLCILLPWGVIGLQADGVRTASSYYQYGVHCLFKGLLAEWNLNSVVEMPSSIRSVEERVRHVHQHIVPLVKA